MNNENLSAVLFGKVRRAILGLFFFRPDESFYLRQITRITGTGQGAVQRELKRLSEAGIISRTGRGRQVYYQANRACSIFDELRGLMMKTAGLADVLRDALAPLSGQIDVAFVYGSQAAGTATAASDVDLMIVGAVDEIALHRAVSQAEGHLARTVNYTLIDRREFERRREEKGGFLDRVLNGEKIFIAGTSGDV